MSVTVMSAFFALLTLVALAGTLVAGAALAVGERASRLRDLIARHALGAAAAVTGTAVAGSLYYSESVGFVPCELCWFQRIFAYPLAVILGVALLAHLARSRGRGIAPPADVWVYALPLAAMGLGISAWHTAIQRLPTAGEGACDPAVPCSAIYVEQFGFITIPVMAGAAFVFTLAWGGVALLARHRDSPTPSARPFQTDQEIQ